MIATLLSAFFGSLTIVALVAILHGFRRSFDSLDEVTRTFVTGLGILFLGYIMRGFYWDVVWQSFHYYYPHEADNWRRLTNDQAINVTFYAISLIGVYYIMLARQLMILPEDRHRWPWYKAWMHPETKLRLMRWPDRRNNGND